MLQTCLGFARDSDVACDAKAFDCWPWKWHGVLEHAKVA